MAFSVLGSVVSETVIEEKRCVEKIWPNWWDDLENKVRRLVYILWVFVLSVPRLFSRLRASSFTRPQITPLLLGKMRLRLWLSSGCEDWERPSLEDWLLRR